MKDMAKDVLEHESLDHVLGYCCFNDVTERSIVSRNIADLNLAKGRDTFSCLGSYLVTELDPNDLPLTTYLNGTLVQHDTTRNRVFSIQHVLHYLFQCMTLCPGYVVEAEAAAIGRLHNIVRGEP